MLLAFLGPHFLKEEAGRQYVLVSEETAETSGTDAKDHRKTSLEILMGKHKEMNNSLQQILKITTLPTEEEKLKGFDNFERQFLGLLKEEEASSEHPFIEEELLKQ